MKTPTVVTLATVSGTVSGSTGRSIEGTRVAAVQRSSGETIDAEPTDNGEKVGPVSARKIRGVHAY